MAFMKKIILLIVAIVLTINMQAQVGFNNPNPHPRSILDLTATDKGLLVPRLTSAQRDALTPVIDALAESLLVYDTNLLGFYFFQGGAWYALNEWTKIAGSNNVSLTGNATINGNLNVSGFAINALVPSGGIIMWSGSIASIPVGWVLCNGANGTPDLRDRFIVGAGSSYGPGGFGGNNLITISTNQLPPHSHTGITSPVGDHNHTYADDFSYIDRLWNFQFPGSYLQNLQVLGNYSGNGTTDGASNTFAGRNKNTGSSGSHTHSFTTDNTGSNQSIDIRPNYYALAYIMKQ
jgi:hypothetical protein